MEEKDNLASRKHITEQFFKIVRFGISGLIATGTNVLAFYVLVTFFHMWYILASMCSFLFGFFASFTLQKFWTFRDKGTSRLHAQAVVYLAIVLCNLAINTALVYLFVEYGHLLPVIAQTLASFLIACESFFAYKYFVFKDVGTLKPGASESSLKV